MGGACKSDRVYAQSSLADRTLLHDKLSRKLNFTIESGCFSEFTKSNQNTFSEV